MFSGWCGGEREVLWGQWWWCVGAVVVVIPVVVVLGHCSGEFVLLEGFFWVGLGMSAAGRRVYQAVGLLKRCLLRGSVDSRG
jgi:hypothetical protein